MGAVNNPGKPNTAENYMSWSYVYIDHGVA